MPRPTADRQADVRHALVLMLTLNAGATDAIGFLALGGAFTSVMTGNLVLFGISAAHADGALARHTATAIACFIAGCVIGARLAGTARRRSGLAPLGNAYAARSIRHLLRVRSQLVVCWWPAARSSPTRAPCRNAVGLGIQSSTVQRFGVSGLSTTYMTGTLTTLVVRLSSGHRIRDIKGSAQLLIALVAGAVLSGVLNRDVPSMVPLLQLASTGSVIVFSTLLTPLRSRLFHLNDKPN